MTVHPHPTALRTRPDAELVAELRAEHPAAVGELVARYQAPLTGFARGLLRGDHHDAEEVVQDVLMRALAALRRDERPVALKPWLHTITRNACLDRLRRPVRTTSLEPFELVLRGSGDDPHERAVGREELSALVGGLRALPRRQRVALVGHELEGRSHEQLAAELDVTVAATKALVCRARRGMAQLAGAG